MSSTPEMPTFPKNCIYAISGFLALGIVLFIINRFLRSDTDKVKDEAENSGESTLRGPLTMPIIICAFLFFGTIAGCVWYYDTSRKSWIYKYGSQEQKIAQAVSDAISLSRR